MVSDVWVELVLEAVVGEVQAFQGWVEQVEGGYVGIEANGVVLFFAWVFVAGSQWLMVNELKVS